MTLFLRGELGRSLLRPIWSAAAAPCVKKIGSDAGGLLVAKSEVTAFIERCMVAAGTKPAHAKALADNLTMADYRGHFSHGLNRLGNIVLIVCIAISQNTLATVPSRRYRRRQAYEYRQDLIYLSMVICIFISFPLSVVLKCQRHFVVKFWLCGSFRVRSWG